jgi:hypothetical protein
MPPDRGLSDRARPGTKGVKNRLTYVFTVNADGSDKRPAFIIGKAKQPRAFKKKTAAQLGFHYRSNAQAWMTESLYQEWIQQWDTKLHIKQQKILLLQDNFAGHKPPSNLTNITVVNFVPNLTSHVQPLDAGIIRAFKAHYRQLFIARAIDRYDNEVRADDVYKINQLEAMRLAQQAWTLVSECTITNC